MDTSIMDAIKAIMCERQNDALLELSHNPKYRNEMYKRSKVLDELDKVKSKLNDHEINIVNKALDTDEYMAMEAIYLKGLRDGCKSMLYLLGCKDDFFYENLDL